MKKLLSRNVNKTLKMSMQKSLRDETLGWKFVFIFNNFVLPWNQTHKSQIFHKSYHNLYRHARKLFWYQYGAQEMKNLPSNFKNKPKIRFENHLQASSSSSFSFFSFSLSLSLSLLVHEIGLFLANQGPREWPWVIPCLPLLRSTLKD